MQTNSILACQHWGELESLYFRFELTTITERLHITRSFLEMLVPHKFITKIVNIYIFKTWS